MLFACVSCVFRPCPFYGRGKGMLRGLPQYPVHRSILRVSCQGPQFTAGETSNDLNEFAVFMDGIVKWLAALRHSGIKLVDC